MATFPDKQEYAQLTAQLANSKFQVTNNPAYQVILALIKAADSFAKFSQQSFPQGSGSNLNIIELLNLINSKIQSIITGPATSLDNEIVLFDGTTGRKVKGATGTGFVFATNGVYSVVPPTALEDHVVMSDGALPTPSPVNDGFGNFIYVSYTP